MEYTGSASLYCAAHALHMRADDLQPPAALVPAAGKHNKHTGEEASKSIAACAPMSGWSTGTQHNMLLCPPPLNDSTAADAP